MEEIMVGLYETSDAYREQLEEELKDEQDHSAFLEKLIEALYGEGWNKLTIDDAKKWRESWQKKT